MSKNNALSIKMIRPTVFFIKEENLVAILVDGRKSGARLGEVSISPYYAAKRVNLECSF